MEDDTIENERLYNIYRFGGFRYGLRGPYQEVDNEVVPQLPGLYAFPRKDIQKDYEPSEDPPGELEGL